MYLKKSSEKPNGKRYNTQINTSNMRLTYLFIPIISLCFSSCTPSVPSNKDLIKVALDKSGNNRSQLEQVLDHYRTADPDSQKLAAAEFLIANMDDKTGYAVRNTVQYQRLLDSLSVLSDPFGWDPYLSTAGQWLDSMTTATPLQIGAQSDLRHITADYLIANIDAAFDQWRRVPWAKHYTFAEFCEWVLPYRTGNERLEDWRPQALAVVPSNTDSLRQAGDWWNLGVSLINNTRIYYNIGMGGFPLPMTFGDMTTAKRGACGQMADYALKLFRAQGIPSAVDMIPVWANRSSNHIWNTLVLPGGKSRDISYSPTGENKLVYKISKIYRQRFSPLRNDPLYPLLGSGDLPGFFADCRLEDVTAQYDMPVSDIAVADLRKSDRKIAWLCTFDNARWIPVTYAEKSGSKATFKDMARGILPGENESIAYISNGPGIAYLPAYYVSGQLAVAASPRILREDEAVEVLNIDTVHRQTLTINRKYPKHPDFDNYEKEMIGARFEGANRANFSDAVTLLTIDRQQGYPMERRPVQDDNARRTFRYVRYISLSGYRGNVAEIGFFDHEKQLDGKPIGIDREVPERGLKALFDGDLESFYYGRDTLSFWGGLDLGAPKTITEIAFAARTDDNEIRLGDTYQLYYWHDGWQPLPAVVAEDHRLTWANVPSNTLYLLRNLSRGVEQRPFTYENDKQVWW